MTVDPGSTESRQVYKLLTGLVVPRPIAFVSTVGVDGVRNLAPFSFFTAVCANPPVICFCPMVRTSDAAQKDTLRNIEATGEFVVNIVSEDFAREMNACSAEFPPGVDEFAVAGLSPEPSDRVAPPRVREARAAMECRLRQIIPVSDRQYGGNLVLGEVIRFYLDDTIVHDFRVDPETLRPIGRLAGSEYVRTTDRFTMERPRNPVTR